MYGCQSKDPADFRFGAPGRPGVRIITAAIQGSSLPAIFDTGTNGHAAPDADVIARLQLPGETWESGVDSSGRPAGKIPTAVAGSLEFGPLHLAGVEILGTGPHGTRMLPVNAEAGPLAYTIPDMGP